MAKQGAKVSVTDMKQRTELGESIKACEDLKLEYDLGRHNSKTFLSAEMIVVSPGVPLDLKPLQEAREANIPIVSEIDLAAAAIKEPVIAVTGTNGKTTVTTLIGEMFKADKRESFVGGNIGVPLLNHVIEGRKAEAVVAEISSFQLDLSERLVPAVAVFTNIGEDHMDRYPNLDAYVASKKRLLKACDRNSYVVLNYDDPVVARFSAETNAKVLWVTKRDPMKVGGAFAEEFRGVYLDAGGKEVVSKISGKEERYDLSKLRIFGDHNKENFMLALTAARIMGVRPAAVQNVINTFEGIAHRLEFVRRKDGVFFINDSKATNVMSVLKSLSAFKKNPIILIAGGKDKEADFTPLADLVRSRCKIVILMGEAKEKMNRAFGDLSETYLVGTLEEAVLLAYQKSRAGDIIMLAPGCASYDMFRNFEERGDYFKKLVNQL
jgi:UDP-N-acetylmuramoylalanine--D-glutamate ligase